MLIPNVGGRLSGSWATSTPRGKPATTVGFLFSALAALGWGISLAAARYGISAGLGSTDLAFIRYVVASPILIALYLARQPKQFPPTKVSAAFVLALIGGPSLAICIMEGSRLAPFATGVLVELAALAVCCIVLARLVLGERLDALRRAALCFLIARILVLAGPSLLSGPADTRIGILLFAAGGCMAATFTALVCRWRIDPVTAMAIVTISSLVTFGPYYLLTVGPERLASVSWMLLLEEAICQGAIAGVAAWIGFIYSARLLSLVTATFLPAITPAIAVVLTAGFTGEVPTATQWWLIVFSSIGAFLLILRTGSLRSDQS